MDKAAGVTTRLAVKNVLQVKGRGFGVEGILDPFASGLLIAATGDSTRFLSYFLRFEKTYVAELTLGRETDTLDNMGSLTKEMPVPRLLVEVLAGTKQQFQGKILQVPPLFSNVQVDGRRGHQIARAGETAELKPREVTIHSLDLRILNDRTLRMECTVSAGTYIRSLARDIAAALGTCGHLSALRRTAIGPFLVVTKEAPTSQYGEILQSLSDADALGSFAALHLPLDVARRFYQGQRPAVAPDTEHGLRRVFAEDRFIGLGRLEQGRLLVENIYPQASLGF
ncbi:MAG TPA: tRNA pseudouridine(55) synthase TruB [Turneriella sp.]|nr:tRNA pseudouridine(55) synthase TruB [Turneriella sp.]